MSQEGELSERVRDLIEPVVRDQGFDVVRVRISGKKALQVQVMVEPDGGGAMNVDDCAAISRAVSAVLDVDDPITGAYTLEVTSPGIDRPLVRIGDFDRFKGFEAKIETVLPIDGRRRFKGTLAGIEGDLVKIHVDGREMNVSHGDINRAKLLLTDELIAAAEENMRS